MTCVMKPIVAARKTAVLSNFFRLELSRDRKVDIAMHMEDLQCDFRCCFSNKSEKDH